jgi:biopolymer transport protein ExbB
MFIQLAAQEAAAAAGAEPASKFGLIPMLEQGGALTWGIFILLVVMFVFSLYILFAKLWQQQTIITEGKKANALFWNSPSLKDGAGKLTKDGAYRQIVEDGLRAQEQHTLLTDPGDAHDWTMISLGRTRAAIDSKLKGGLAFLATVGSTAPFIGLFGTVIGILGALLNIGIAGQASIDTVAGPVGEALIMTAIGLAVAVPAVLAFNWLQSRNKMISEDLGAFTNNVHTWMASNGAVKPAMARPAMAKAAPAMAKPASAPAKA